MNDIALFLYGFDITVFNQYIDFVTENGTFSAVLNVGNYTATQFMTEIKRAMEFIEGVVTFTVILDRTQDGGRSNAMTVATSGSTLSLLFATGVSAANSPASLMGFTPSDFTGQTSYTGTQAGTVLIPDLPTWNYQTPDSMVEQDGTKNVTSTGIKETLVFAEMTFFQGEWRYITDLFSNDQFTQWVIFLKYATKQLQLEFQPSILEDPTIFYQCTLETTPADSSNGMKFKLEQMTDVTLYRVYKTGVMKFRIVVQ